MLALRLIFFYTLLCAVKGSDCSAPNYKDAKGCTFCPYNKAKVGSGLEGGHDYTIVSGERDYTKPNCVAKCAADAVATYDSGEMHWMNCEPCPTLTEKLSPLMCAGELFDKYDSNGNFNEKCAEGTSTYDTVDGECVNAKCSAGSFWFLNDGGYTASDTPGTTIANECVQCPSGKFDPYSGTAVAGIASSYYRGYVGNTGNSDFWREYYRNLYARTKESSGSFPTIGYYTQKPCTTCPEGWIQPNEGQAQCIKCASGHKKSGLQECAQCPSHQKLNSNFICVDCGYLEEPNADQSECVCKFAKYATGCVAACPTGFYVDSNKECVHTTKITSTLCPNNEGYVSTDYTHECKTETDIVESAPKSTLLSALATCS